MGDGKSGGRVLRFVVTGALMVSPLVGCGAEDEGPTINEPVQETINEPPDETVNEPEPEPEPTVNPPPPPPEEPDGEEADEPPPSE